MSTEILNQLDPVLIILKISDLLRECILEIVHQENILTNNIEHKDILAVSQELKDDDNWFKSVCIFLKYLLRRKEAITENLDEIQEFITNCENINSKPVVGKSEIEFEYIQDDSENNKKTQKIDDKGLFNNFTSPTQTFSDMINACVKAEKPKRVIIDLKIDPTIFDGTKWPLGFLKKSTICLDANLSLDLICSIVYFLNLLLNKNMTTISLNISQYLLSVNLKKEDSHFFDQILNKLDLKNLNVFANMCLFNINSSYSKYEVDKKYEIIKQIFSSKNQSSAAVKDSTLGLGFSELISKNYFEI